MVDAHTDRRPDSMSGFTLFEVLAAALVLVLVGTLTIGSMNADLSRMSDARLRLEAGRIADSTLADIEATLFDGTAPELAMNEEEIDGFIVRIRVAPFGVLFQNAGEPLPPAVEGDEAPRNLFQTIADELPGLPTHLRMIEVKVLWGDPTAPDSVARTTVGFDHTGALEALEQSGQGGQGAERDAS